MRRLRPTAATGFLWRISSRDQLPTARLASLCADTSAGEEEARKVLETRFVIAQLLAADGYPVEAIAELQAVRPLLADAFGLDSVQVRNLDKQAARLNTPQ